MSAWGVQYLESTGNNERLQGRVATSEINVYDVTKYEGALWSHIWFYFSPDDLLVAVQFNGHNEQATLNAFNKMTSAYPVRTQKSIWPAIGSEDVLIKNGKNANEFVERKILSHFNDEIFINYYF
ncbi:MAG: hypothetical protein K6G18_02240 [Treponema sp.]|nr:hypothetical protein [Treponema sp.]